MKYESGHLAIIMGILCLLGFSLPVYAAVTVDQSQNTSSTSVGPATTAYGQSFIPTQGNFTKWGQSTTCATGDFASTTIDWYFCSGNIELNQTNFQSEYACGNTGNSLLWHGVKTMTCNSNNFIAFDMEPTTPIRTEPGMPYYISWKPQTAHAKFVGVQSNSTNFYVNGSGMGRGGTTNYEDFTFSEYYESTYSYSTSTSAAASTTPTVYVTPALCCENLGCQLNLSYSEQHHDWRIETSLDPSSCNVFTNPQQTNYINYYAQTPTYVMTSTSTVGSHTECVIVYDAEGNPVSASIVPLQFMASTTDQCVGHDFDMPTEWCQNLCDDLSTSTSPFDPNYYGNGIICGGRNLSCWAFTPRPEAQQQMSNAQSYLLTKFPFQPAYNLLSVWADLRNATTSSSTEISYNAEFKISSSSPTSTIPIKFFSRTNLESYFGSSFISTLRSIAGWAVYLTSAYAVFKFLMLLL